MTIDQQQGNIRERVYCTFFPLRGVSSLTRRITRLLPPPYLCAQWFALASLLNIKACHVPHAGYLLNKRIYCNKCKHSMKYIYFFAIWPFFKQFSFLCFNEFRDPRGVLVLIVSEIDDSLTLIADFPSFVQKETTFFLFLQIEQENLGRHVIFS